ncbi:hypothetical protein [Aquimarina sp. 2201CG5-10]|uniref:hypothetical protein n=1 Tax=Aquimarina callyspongiae TaxID=3098150 RepID=UPI002AB4C6E0|nr:hypothetical protein [Aquimarina sp. 2201CG5-10]MDY8136427.1 hypothetical protein [Aquimarina sp. 2201CG5-10]
MRHILSNNIHRITVYLVIILYVVFLGVITEPDTGNYAHLTIIAPPGYPIFLFVFKKLLGEESYFSFVVGAQLIFCVISCVYLIKVLHRVFGVKKNLLILLDIILLAPLFIPQFLVANRIVSQGLSYPFFLLIIAFFIEGIFEKKRRSFWYMLLALFVGLLVRTQFFFIIPVLMLVLGYFWKVKKGFRLYGRPLLVLIAIPIIASLVDKTFHYAVSDRFVSTAHTGVQMMTMPLFVADPEDYKVYDDLETQEYFKYVYKTAVDKKITDDYYVPAFGDNVYQYFHYNYVNISYVVLSKEGRQFLMPSDPNSVDALIMNDKFLISMWFPLFWDNLAKCIDLFYKNVKHALGGFYMMLVYLMVLIGSLIIWIKRGEKLALFSLVLMLLVFSNVVLVCLVEHSIDRFMMYQHWMLPVLLVLLYNKIILDKNKESLTDLT